MWFYLLLLMCSSCFMGVGGRKVRLLGSTRSGGLVFKRQILLESRLDPGVA